MIVMYQIYALCMMFGEIKHFFSDIFIKLFTKITQIR